MTDEAIQRAVIELICENSQLKSRQTYLLLANNQLMDRVSALEAIAHRLSKVCLEKTFNSDATG